MLKPKRGCVNLWPRPFSSLSRQAHFSLELRIHGRFFRILPVCGLDVKWLKQFKLEQFTVRFMLQRPIKITDGFISRQDLTHVSCDLFPNTFCRLKVTFFFFFFCRGSSSQRDLLFGAQTEIHFLLWSRHDQHNLWLWVVSRFVTWKLGFRGIIINHWSWACLPLNYAWINILYLLKCKGTRWMCCWEPWGVNCLH